MLASTNGGAEAAQRVANPTNQGRVKPRQDETESVWQTMVLEPVNQIDPTLLAIASELP
jgi:hypothetical protein